MTTIRESLTTSGSQFRALSIGRKVRWTAFTIVVLAFLALNIVMTPPDVLLASFEGWVADLGAHQVHDMTIAALIWLAFIVPMVLLLYRPTRRVNTILAPIIFVIPTAIMAFLAQSFLFGGFAIGAVLALLALALHPAGRSLIRFDRVESIDSRVAGLFALGAIPLLGYAGLELLKQLGPMDEHVIFVHYGAMTNAVLLVVVMGALAIFRRQDWRFATWTAGLVAAFLGLVSVGFPAAESSLGTVGGGLLLLWAVAFVGSVEYVRRSFPTKSDGLDEAVAEPV